MRKTAAVVLLSVAGSVIASDLPDVRGLAAEGMARRDSADVQPFQPPEYDSATVKTLADEAQARSKVELQSIIERYGHDQEGLAQEGEGTAPTKLQGRLVVALSSSMPEQMIRDYFAQLAGHPEAVVVLRGFVGGAQRIGPTGSLMERLMRRTTDRADGHHVVDVLVDPLLYRQLGIDRVPAVAWLDGVEDISHCDQEDYDAAFVVYGATTVAAALKAASDQGARVPRDVVARFRGDSWQNKR